MTADDEEKNLWLEFQERRQRFTAYVIETEVCLPLKFDHNEVCDWLKANAGEARRRHPYDEATMGFLDEDMLGMWAAQTRLDYICYWLRTKELVAKFRLMFGGIASKTLAEKGWID